MTLRYVDGTNGNNANSGLTPALAKASFNGAEDSPVAAGDIIHVRQGTYRETLTVDVSGSAGNLIEYRGDYTGVIFGDPTGGIVRVTGSDNDQTETRTSFLSLAAQRNYRQFTNLHFDGFSSGGLLTSSQVALGWVVDKCYFALTATSICINMTGNITTPWLIQNCFFQAGRNGSGVRISHSSVLSNIAHLIQNCIFMTGNIGVDVQRVGGATVKNCRFTKCTTGVSITVALTAGQTITVNNCPFDRVDKAMGAINLGEITSDYNNFYGNSTANTNVANGANDKFYLDLTESRWFFQLVNAGAGPNNAMQLITPFDLAPYSQLVNVAGTNPAATDMRGTAVQGAQREFGPLEHDSTLKIRGGINKSRLLQGH